MTTIEIVREHAGQDELRYRAIHGKQYAEGATPGQALDSLERLLATRRDQEKSGTLVIVQRFNSDVFFTAEQKVRLRFLMDRYHEAQAEGLPLSDEEHAEPEQLVDAEMDAVIDRSKAILSQDQAS